LRARFGVGKARLRELAPNDVTDFTGRLSQDHGSGFRTNLLGALRTFLRYLYYRGETAIDLSDSVPSAAKWALSGLPEALGHESLQSTQIYMDTDLEFKEKVLNEAPVLIAKVGRFRADDRLIAFLKNL
jgi:hypothetical protein